MQQPNADAKESPGFSRGENVKELAGRTAYKSEDKITDFSAAGFVKKILDRNHTAVIEFGEAAVRFVTDRGVSHEALRHRIASYVMESTRYCNYGKEKFGREIMVVEPPGLDEEQRAAWIRAVATCETEYLRLIDLGQSPQIARSVLPTCLKTEFVMKTNFRSWRNFFSLRCAPSAHPQMQQLAKLALAILHDVAPTVFKDQWDQFMLEAAR